eukprot:CAMPEP_0184509044 /NCGR_PEP_ID=MMETSP0198_2-20121128/1076_1 /TAXON_ID=1112570 /ORGANISM="Thraustochytrium sp., Strain LLF1b" /LENGTH=561 /DNA_ID=CAMNT_0026898853 /DNA_START=86 /DNA_END=1771 /DNA_ORIENTATION=+
MSTIELGGAYVPPPFVANGNLADLEAIELDDMYFRNALYVPGLLFWVPVALTCCSCFQSCCCTCSYRQSKSARRVAFMLFTVVMMLVVILCLFSIPREITFDEEFGKLVNASIRIDPIISDWSLQFNESGILLDTTEGHISTLSGCSQNLGASTEFRQVLDASLNLIRALRDRVESFSEGFSNTTEIVFDTREDTDDLQTVNYTGSFVIRGGLAITAAYILLSTSLLYANPGRRMCKPAKRCYRKSSCCISFTFATIFTWMIVLASCFLAFIGRVGIDICVPNPDQGILEAVAFFGDVDTMVLGECSASSLGTNNVVDIQQTICFYQSCSDASFYFEDALRELDETRSNLLEAMEEEKPSGGFPDGTPQNCEFAFEALEQILRTDLVDRLVALEESFQCEPVNRVYQDVFHDKFCNGVLSNSMLNMWHLIYTAAIFTLVGMFLYLHFNLGRPKDSLFDVHDDDIPKFAHAYNDADADDASNQYYQQYQNRNSNAPSFNNGTNNMQYPDLGANNRIPQASVEMVELNQTSQIPAAHAVPAYPSGGGPESSQKNTDSKSLATV